MSIFTGKDGYSVRHEYETRTRNELAKRDFVFVRDTVLHKDEVEWVASQLRGRKRVLELGCGFGPWSLIATVCGCAYEGVDLIPERIGYAIRRYFDIPFYVGDARTFTAPVGNFDTILLVTVLQHLTVPDAKAVLWNAARHLAGDGLIVMLESGIGNMTVEQADAIYSDPRHPSSMIPKPLRLLREATPGFEWDNDGIHDHWIAKRR